MLGIPGGDQDTGCAEGFEWPAWSKWRGSSHDGVSATRTVAEEANSDRCRSKQVVHILPSEPNHRWQAGPRPSKRAVFGFRSAGAKLGCGNGSPWLQHRQVFALAWQRKVAERYKRGGLP